MAFTIFDDEKIKPYLDSIEGDSRAPDAGQDEAPGTGGSSTGVGMESMEH
jgi:hypothetical protein